jgi:sphingosine kinase
LSKVHLTIHYAKHVSKQDVCVAYINYVLDLSSSSAAENAKAWVSNLLDRAYGRSQRQKRIKVLINPFGGAGKAAKWFARDIEPIFAAAKCKLDVERTMYMGHAVEIAEGINENDFDVIASCSGDGLPHEVFNGLARKANAAEALRKIAVVQLPCGTGNAMSWNLNGTGSCSLAALCIVKGIRTSLDLASFTQRDKRTISFLSQAIGIVAETDLGTDNMRWMGSARFTYGFFVRLLGKTVYPCDLAVKTVIDDKPGVKAHYAKEVAKTRSKTTTDLLSESPSIGYNGLPPLRYGTPATPLPPDFPSLTPYPNLGNFYCGNMAIMAESTPFFPSALPADGLLDLITIPGDIRRTEATNLLLSVEKGKFFDKKSVTIRKVEAYRVVPRFGKWANSRTGQMGSTRKGTLGRVLDKLGLTGGGGVSRDGGYIAVDGEKMPFEPFQVEVHPGLGTVLSKSGGVYESPGPTGWETAGTSSPTEQHRPAAVPTPLPPTDRQ